MGTNNVSKKFIIVNWGKACVGKTPSLRIVFDILSSKYPATILEERNGKDIKAVVTIGKYKIGIETQGDPKPYFVTADSMADFRQIGCQIVVAACRTSGNTWNAVYEMESQYGYHLIEALHHRTYDIKLPDTSYEIINTHYAEGVVAIIEDIIFGKI